MATHDNSKYFGPQAPKAQDAPADEFFGYPSQEALREGYQREMREISTALDHPVQDKVAAADRYAHSKRSRSS